MKKFLNQYKWILLIGCFIFSTVLGIYFYTFRHYGLSDTTSVWGSFGSYLGGVLAPILSFTSIILIIYSINQQKNNNDRQKFETTFFKLIELHQNEIHNLEIKKKDLHKYEANSHMTEVLKSNEILKELMDVEEKNLQEYFYIQAYKKNNPENLYVYNYRALNNHFIQTRDYLNSIINNIVYISRLIKEAEITPEEKAFYKRIFKYKLRDAENFFLVVFYIQIHNSIKDHISREEVMELAGPKEWILKPMVLNDSFPFCIPGMCIGDPYLLEEPYTHYKITLSSFLKEEFFYLIKLINLNAKCERLKIYLNNDLEQMFGFPLSHGELKNRTFEYNLKGYFQRHFFNSKGIENLQPITFFNVLKPYCDENLNFSLGIEIVIYLGDEQYLLRDTLQFQFQTNGEFYLLINSSKNIAWNQNWRMRSFRQDAPAKT